MTKEQLEYLQRIEGLAKLIQKDSKEILSESAAAVILSNIELIKKEK